MALDILGKGLGFPFGFEGRSGGAQVSSATSNEHEHIRESIVQNEIISHFIEQDYLDPMDDAVIDDLIEEFRRRGLDPEVLGLSRDDLRQRLIQARTRESIEPREIPVSPQRRRQESRRRLNERARTLASRILNAIGTSVAGRDIALAYPEFRSVNNYAAVIQIVNSAVNQRLEADAGTRGEIPLERIEEVMDQLDEVGDVVQAEIQERLSATWAMHRLD